MKNKIKNISKSDIGGNMDAELGDDTVLAKWRLWKILNGGQWKLGWVYNDSCATCRNWGIGKFEKWDWTYMECCPDCIDGYNKLHPEEWEECPRFLIAHRKIFLCKIKMRKGKYQYWECNKVCKKFSPNNDVMNLDWSKYNMNHPDVFFDLYFPKEDKK